MVNGRPFIPQHEQQREGRDRIRLPFRHLLDPAGPHYYEISVHLEKMRRAGVEIDQTTADNATKLIHWEREQPKRREEERQRQEEPLRANWREPTPYLNLKVGIVYYILRQRLIKIGTTVQPLQRFEALMPDAILAVEPGGETLERSRHREFKPLRSPQARGEYFLPAPSLLDHIRALREEHGLPSYKFRSLISADESQRLVAELLAEGGH